MSPKHGHKVKLAYQDPNFMDSAAARPVRIITEYLDPLARLRREGVADTIVMFGSARILPKDRAEQRLKLARKAAAKHRTPATLDRLRLSRYALDMSHYYEEARELSRLITSWSMSFGDRPRRFVVCSGGGPGIMEAANRGAADAGGKSVGLSIELPHEQAPNPYISRELSFNFHYFFMRKLWFAQIAKALIVFPGGFGTLDELWEMMTLSQTGKMPKHTIIIIYGRKYWNEVLKLENMVRWGTISQADFDNLQYADSVDEAFDKIRMGLEKYHMEGDPFLQAY